MSISEVLSTVAAVLSILLLAAIAYQLWLLRRERLNLDLVEAILRGRDPDYRALYEKQAEAIASLTRSAEVQATSFQRTSEGAMAFLQRQSSQDGDVAALLRSIAHDTAEVRRSLASGIPLNERLRRMTALNLDLVTDPDDTRLADYAASEMLLAAKLQLLEDDLLGLSDEEWNRRLRASIPQRLLEWAKRNKIAEKLLGKLNELAKDALGGIKGP